MNFVNDHLFMVYPWPWPNLKSSKGATSG